jgi:hypothetical protein
LPWLQRRQSNALQEVQAAATKQRWRHESVFSLDDQLSALRSKELHYCGREVARWQGSETGFAPAQSLGATPGSIDEPDELAPML